MKLKFESNLEYQTEAVKSVTDLFEGQTSMMSYFPINGQTGFDRLQLEDGKLKKESLQFGKGMGNSLTINNEVILENLRKVQAYNELNLSESLHGLDFNIEMETGTGKTYVYLKTIFELNKLYGFTKFIIVVPSIAIKEGVFKTLQITKDHFKGLYNNVIYDYFIYDSRKLDQVRTFAESSNIEIMIINIDAFNKCFTKAAKKSAADETKKTNNCNIIFRPQEKLNWYRPIDLIAETNPIVIIDEPQSVMGGQGEEAVASLNPLCTLRYSATHREIQNLVYKLDAIDAYENHLVKGIEVAGIESVNAHNEAYLKLISVDIKSKSAKIEVDALVNGKIKRKPITVKQGYDLSERKYTGRDIYTGYTVDEIYFEKGYEYVSFNPKDVILKIGSPIGELDDLARKRVQIRKTIEEHLDKELKFNPKGIKVLSLFFIDKVSNYRVYAGEGHYYNGTYADIFEEEYEKIIAKPKYAALPNYEELKNCPEDAHYGYFSQDKNGAFIEYEQNEDGSFKLTKKIKELDNKAYIQIMKDKETLLSFDSKLRFIFSHSALKEGWDNPNVFQICTLNETTSNIKKRQEIGRGLRLCVNQEGERILDENINILTVMANESYEEFVKNLQTELEDETGIKFEVIEVSTFAYITMPNKKGELKPIGEEASEEIFDHFIEMKYINGLGKVQDALRVAISNEDISVPEIYEPIKKQILDEAKKHTKIPPVKNRDEKRKVKVNKQVLLSPDFEEFWDRIKHKTTYSVNFSTGKLINKCSEALAREINVQSPKLIYTKSGLVIDATGVSIDEEGKIPPSVVYTHEEEVALPDIITFLQNETYLTRRTIVEVLISSDTIDQFKKNPQQYMEQALQIIKREMNHMLIDGIKYTQLEEYYAQELFEKEELYGYLNRNLLESEHSVYDYVVYDSDKEMKFAKKLEKDPKVKLYAKLPGWFKINTPLGGYNPDWAVLFDDDGIEKLYFVVETKGNVDVGSITSSMKQSEIDKINCGREHFKALNSEVKFTIAADYDIFKGNVIFKNDIK